MSSKKPARVFPWLAVLIPCVVVLSGYAIYQSIYKDILPQPSTPAASPTVSTQANDWKEVKAQTALFFSEIFLERNKTFVLIPIKFHQSIQTAWLTLLSTTDSSKISSFLMTHPQLTNLTWSDVSDGPVHLYQKQKKYASIQEFLNHPPAESSVLIDHFLRGIPPYNQLKGFTLKDNTEVDKFEYLLTTFVKSPVIEGGVQYENIIDASDARPNQNNRIGWQVFVENASASGGFSLGSIHVDYRR